MRLLQRITISALCLFSVTQSICAQVLTKSEDVDKVVQQYQDSLLVLKARLDSVQTLQMAYTAFDKYRLFTSSTFYNEVAQQKLGLDNPVKDSVNQEIDNALMNIYLKHPELVRLTEKELAEAGAVKQEITEPIENKAALVENVVTTAPEVDVVAAPEPDIVVKKPNFWAFKGDYVLQFLQNYISGNWYKGGESYYSMLASATLEANYNNKQKVKWDNKLELKMGFMTSRSDSLHEFKTSEDLIRLTSKLGLQATKHWYYTLQMIAETQFTQGYKSNDRKVYSDFFSPFKLNFSLGMTYNVEWFNKKLTGTINLSPAGYNFRYVGRQNLVTAFGITEGRHALHDFGSSLTADLTWQLANNIKWKSRLYGFTSYKRAEIEWENTFSFQFNKYIAANVFLYPRFDDSSSKKDDNTGYWQFKEYLSLGFNYSF